MQNQLVFISKRCSHFQANIPYCMKNSLKTTSIQSEEPQNIVMEFGQILLLNKHLYSLLNQEAKGRGMTENVWHIWVLRLNHCTTIPNTMMNLRGLNVQLSEQYLEMGPIRTETDYDHCKKFLQWLEVRKPFLCSKEHLIRCQVAQYLSKDRTMLTVKCRRYRL